MSREHDPGQPQVSLSFILCWTECFSLISVWSRLLSPSSHSVLGTLAATYLTTAIIIKYHTMPSVLVHNSPLHTNGYVRLCVRATNNGFQGSKQSACFTGHNSKWSEVQTGLRTDWQHRECSELSMLWLIRLFSVLQLNACFFIFIFRTVLIHS